MYLLHNNSQSIRVNSSKMVKIERVLLLLIDLSTLSLELNPIKNMCAYIVLKWQENCIKTKYALFKHAETVW